VATGKQKAFVAAYLSNGLNATEAAKTAGYQGSYSTLAVIGHENLKKPNIKTEIEAALNERAMTRDEVLYRIAEQARGNILDVSDIRVIDAEQGYIQIDPSLAAAMQKGKAQLIQAVDYDKEGRLKLKLYSAQRALDMLAKAHGIYGDPGDRDEGRFDEYLEQIKDARAKYDAK
jgi:phage terminase small subunit